MILSDIQKRPYLSIRAEMERRGYDLSEPLYKETTAKDSQLTQHSKARTSVISDEVLDLFSRRYALERFPNTTADDPNSLSFKNLVGKLTNQNGKSVSETSIRNYYKAYAYIRDNEVREVVEVVEQAHYNSVEDLFQLSGIVNGVNIDQIKAYTESRIAKVLEEQERLLRKVEQLERRNRALAFIAYMSGFCKDDITLIDMPLIFQKGVGVLAEKEYISIETIHSNDYLREILKVEAIKRSPYLSSLTDSELEKVVKGLIESNPEVMRYLPETAQIKSRFADNANRIETQ